MTSAHDSTAVETPSRPGVGAFLLARWPSLLGAVMIAASSFDGVDVYVVALTIAFAVLCYLAAASTGRSRGAWFAFGVGFVVMPIGLLTRLDLSIPLLAVGVALVLFGLVRLPRTGWRELAIQSGGGVAFGAIAFLAIAAAPVVGAHIAAFGIIGHGVWDVVHHRRDKVVSHSFAEFCAVLDFGIGALLLVVTWVGVLA